MKVHLTLVSSNAKTGPIPVTTSSMATCPDSCQLKGNGCYAASGPLALHWRSVTAGERGMDWSEFTDEVTRFRKGQLWRHNQAGDLPGAGDMIDRKALKQLVKANKGKRGFTYTHKPTSIASNADAIAHANANGFAVNLSADNLSDADYLYSLGIGPVVTIVPEDHPTRSTTPAGNAVVVCPAQTVDGITCATCGACAVIDRESIIAFRVHGSSKRKAANVFYKGGE